MKQKLIFLDIDGTLLPPGEMIVPESAVDAIHRARANGHKVFLCTGRNLRMTQPLFHYGFDGFVCSAACEPRWNAPGPNVRWKCGTRPTAASR